MARQLELQVLKMIKQLLPKTTERNNKTLVALVKSLEDQLS